MREVFFFKKDFFLFMGMSVFAVCLCTDVPGAQGGQRRVPDALELEPQMALGPVWCWQLNLGHLKEWQCL